MDNKQLKLIFSQALPPSLLDLIYLIAKEAHSRKFRIFLVGGLSRDLFLGIKSKDVDILVEGSAIDFAQNLKNNWKENFPSIIAPDKLIRFPKYQTAKLVFPNDIAPGFFTLDFSSTRKERYPLPGRAPIVQAALIEEDLIRRDFSINAIAVELLPNSELKIFDLHQGINDLREKKLRILHENSFLEDPARLIRGLRFVNRFSFKFEEETEKLFKLAVKDNFLSSLTRKRLFDEFRKALEEKESISLLKLMEQSGVLSQIVNKYDITQVRNDQSWIEKFYALIAARSVEELMDYLQQYDLSPKEAENLVKKYF